MRPIDSESDAIVAVPARVVAAAIRGLEAGADAILDRDWACYSPEEHAETERYAEEAFICVARALEHTLSRQSSKTDVSSDRSFRRS
jgi:hypothetical protein